MRWAGVGVEREQPLAHLLQVAAGGRADLADYEVVVRPATLSAVGDWLNTVGLSEADLRCGSHMPRDRDENRRLTCSDESPCQLHNNCSGKHAGFLTLNQHLRGGPDYVDADHPVQQAVRGGLVHCPAKDIAAKDDGRNHQACAAKAYWGHAAILLTLRLAHCLVVPRA